ncbi:polymer-forming cytoskeletal protein, partial [Vibrio sp. 1562]|nr:polymer-forming cytoskeletal protein [Vibrio sp. 1562]
FSIESDGTTYRCTGKLVLPAGDKIVSSLPEKEITLKADYGIVLEGNNTIGEPNKRISLHALATGLTVNNEKASNLDDYQNKHTVIYGDLLSAYPTKLHNVLIDGDIVLTGSTLHIDGKYNTIIGKILTHSTTDIFNANVCGTIESKGHQLHLKTKHPFQQHFVVGDIVAHSSLLIDDMAVYGTTESKAASTALNGAC